MNLQLRYTNQPLAHMTYIISYAPAVNTVNRRDVFVCILLHRELYNACRYIT